MKQETVSLTERANKWIADSRDDTEGLREAAEVMVGLMETQQATQYSLEVSEKALQGCVEEINRLKLQLSGRTYCHSDKAVEARCKELEEKNIVLYDALQQIHDTFAEDGRFPNVLPLLSDVLRKAAAQ